jgi:opacity protein-like surface antigen
MKNFSFALILALILAAPSFAQTPRVEIFGGGTWLRADLSPDLNPVGLGHVNAIGWEGSATENLNSWFGGTLDFSGVYSRPTVKIATNAFGPGLPATNIAFTNGINADAYTVMYGPTVAYRRGQRIVPFGRLLLGALNARASTTSKGAAAIGIDEKFSRTRFAYAAGGGADIALSPLFALRVTAEWIRSTFADFSDDRQNNIRISGGLVVRFGSR